MVQQFQAGSEIPVNDQALTKDDLSQPRSGGHDNNNIMCVRYR